jgi:hypothetical protein
MAQQYKISLGDQLRKSLDTMSEKNGRPVSEEIRDRLQKSFEYDFIDPMTLRLGQNLMSLAAEIDRQCGAKWYEHPVVFEALQVAITAWMAQAGPTSEDAPKLSEPVDPQTLGRTVSSMLYRYAQMRNRPGHQLYDLAQLEDWDADQGEQS